MQVLGVTESAVNYLREQIITGALKPGQRLNEMELAESLGISRPPLREALRTLTKDYLVSSIPRRGAFVTELSLHDLEEIFSARLMVESYAIDIMAEKDIREVSHLMEAVEQTNSLPPVPPAGSPDWLDFLKPFSGFHYQLVDTAQNMFLHRFYDVIGYNLARYQVQYLKLSGSITDSFKDHTQIIDFLSEGQHAKAKELLGIHLKNTHRRLEKTIKAQGSMTEEAVGD